MLFQQFFPHLFHTPPIFLSLDNFRNTVHDVFVQSFLYLFSVRSVALINILLFPLPMRNSIFVLMLLLFRNVVHLNISILQFVCKSSGLCIFLVPLILCLCSLSSSGADFISSIFQFSSIVMVISREYFHIDETLGLCLSVSLCDQINFR